jgi:hypothetical protein
VHDRNGNTIDITWWEWEEGPSQPWTYGDPLYDVWVFPQTILYGGNAVTGAPHTRKVDLVSAAPPAPLRACCRWSPWPSRRQR